MSDHCEAVSAVLGLYAEGELHDPRAVEQARGHLLDCAGCRDTLERHDALTRTLLAGEPERLADDEAGWADLERGHRVEGVLRRLDRSSPPVTGERASGVPVETSDALEARLLTVKQTPGPGRPRLRLSLDDPAPAGGAATGRRTYGTRRAFGFRRFALAAAALLGVSVWLAATPSGTLSRVLSSTLSRLLSGGAPDAVRQVLLDPPNSSATLVDVSSDQPPDDLAAPRREGDRPLRWVVRGGGDDLRLRFAPFRGRTRPGATELLYGVDYGRDAPTRLSTVAVSPPPDDAEIEWVVEVHIVDAPNGRSETLSEPRFLLVPVASDPPHTSSGRSFDAGGVWFRPGRIERRRAWNEAAPLLKTGSSTVCRVCVYEGIRRLELPDQSWTPVPWRTPSTFGGGPRRRMAPLPLPTFSWRSPDVTPEPDLRF